MCYNLFQSIGGGAADAQAVGPGNHLSRTLKASVLLAYFLADFKAATMTPGQANQLVYILEQAKMRPALFFPLDESGLQGFLTGIHTAQPASFGPFRLSSVTDDILGERGWNVPNALGPWSEMKERGYDFSLLLSETLAIEIETLPRMYLLSTQA